MTDTKPESMPSSMPGETSDAPPAELPALYAGDLDGALFEDYFADLEALAVIEAITVKSGAQLQADAPQLSLDQARMLLIVGSVRGVQLRYRYENTSWIDTLVRQSATVHLVRLQAPGPPVAATPERAPAETPATPRKRVHLPIVY